MIIISIVHNSKLHEDGERTHLTNVRSSFVCNWREKNSNLLKQSCIHSAVLATQQHIYSNCTLN